MLPAVFLQLVHRLAGLQAGRDTEWCHAVCRLQEHGTAFLVDSQAVADGTLPRTGGDGITVHLPDTEADRRGGQVVYRLQHAAERVHPAHDLRMIAGDSVVPVVLHAVYAEVIARLVAHGLQPAQLRVHPDQRAEEHPAQSGVPEVDDRVGTAVPADDDPAEAGGDDRQPVHPVAALHDAPGRDGVPADRPAREDRIGIVGEAGRRLSVRLQHVVRGLGDRHGTLFHLPLRGRKTTDDETGK